MAKKNKEERQAKRADKKAGKVEEKRVQKLDEAKIRLADESFKASKKAKRKSRKEPLDVGAAKFNEQPRKKAGVTHIDAGYNDGTVVTKDYPSLADYAKENPKSVTPTISGHDPETEARVNIIDKADSYGEMKGAAPVSSELAKTVNDVSKQAEEVDLAVDVESAERARQKSEDDGTRNTEAGYEKHDDSSYLGDAARSGTGAYTMTDEEFARAGENHRRQAAFAKANAPAAAIDELGIDHYYPPQQDYMTSNFTGRYIGSRQLVSATGALYPEGLIDARKRAMQAKAKANVENQEKFWALNDTTPQYDEQYKDIGMDMLNKYYDLSGGDIDGLLSGGSKLARQFQRDMYDYKSRGKNLEDINTSINALVTKMNEGKEYIPPEIIKNMFDFRAGTSDLEAYMQGKAIGDDQIKSLSNALRSYQNFTPIANKQLEILKSVGGDKLPLNPNADLSDPTFATRLEETVAQYKNKGVGYDEYLSAMGEFYDVEAIETIVRQMYDTNTLYEGTTPDEYEEQIQNGTKYFMSVLPDKIDVTQKLQNNQNLGWASLNQRDRHFNKQQERLDREQTGLWDDVNNDMLSDEMRSGALAALSKSKDPATRAKALQMMYGSTDKTSYNLGGMAVAKVPTRGTTTAYTPSDNFEVLGSDGNMYPIHKMIEFREKRLKKYAEGSSQYNTAKEELEELRYVKNKNGNLQHQVSGRFAGYGVYDANDNTYTSAEHYSGEITNDNLINMGYETGHIGMELEDSVEGKIQVKPSKFTYVTSANIEASEVRRAYQNREGGEEIRKRSYLGEEYETSKSTSTYSSGNQPAVSGGRVN